MKNKANRIDEKKRILIKSAENLLEYAFQESREGFEKKDDKIIRDTAEKAWLAANEAVDAAMVGHGQVPQPGPKAHHDRHRFLETVDRELSKELSYFADQLHGSCFYQGICPSEQGMEAFLEEVRQFIKKMKEA